MVVHVFAKKSQKTPPRVLRLAEQRAKWMRHDPEYRAEYEALEEEFTLASALIEARSRAGLTQEELAHRMKTTQAAIARLESGRFKPSTRTLERFAEATRTRLQISFVPEAAE